MIKLINSIHKDGPWAHIYLYFRHDFNEHDYLVSQFKVSWRQQVTKETHTGNIKKDQLAAQELMK